jgi:hypothetical protein
MGRLRRESAGRFRRSRWLRALLVALVLAGLGLPGEALAKKPRKGGRRPSTGIVRQIDPRGKRADRRGTKLKRRPTLGNLQGSTAPRIQVMAEPLEVPVGGTVRVTVRMMEGHGSARHAAFHVGTDPSVLRYRGYAPTGRGALLVQESQENPGEIVVYRSSLPEGFLPVEPLVELEFDTLGRGDGSVSLTEIRLLDRRARDMEVTYEAGSLQIR